MRYIYIIYIINHIFLHVLYCNLAIAPIRKFAGIPTKFNTCLLRENFPADFCL